MHEHTTIIVRGSPMAAYSTTLGKLYAKYREGGPRVEVLDQGGWTPVLDVLRHPQAAGASSLFIRTRGGHFGVFQDGDVLMARVNLAACPNCKTYPHKTHRENYSCRKCNYRWAERPEAVEPPQAVLPSRLTRLSHRGSVIVHTAAPVAIEPPLRDGWLAGMYVAEGTAHVRDGGYFVGFGISQTPGTAICNRVLDALTMEHPLENVTLVKSGAHVYSTSLGKYYPSMFGRYCRNVALPDGWMGLPTCWLADFLSGLIDGDGTAVQDKNCAWGRVTIDTTSVALAAQVQDILWAVGVPCSVVLTPFRPLSNWQGLAVSFVATEFVGAFLSSSEKVASATGYKPKPNARDFEDVIDLRQAVHFQVGHERVPTSDGNRNVCGERLVGWSKQ